MRHLASDKLAALIESLRQQPDAFAQMPPAERRRLADVCRYIADKAEPRGPSPSPETAGILSDLRRGIRAD
jgi:hypothetical protein